MAPVYNTLLLLEEIPIVRYVVNEFSTKVPPVLLGNVELIPCRSLRSHYLGVSDGKHWGWWGPLHANVAVLLASLMKSLPIKQTRSLSAWLTAFQRNVRPNHSSREFRMAVSAFDLALWDLLGKRADAPIWALLEPNARDVPRCYLTAFNLLNQRIGLKTAFTLAHEERWSVIKFDEHDVEQLTGGVLGALEDICDIADGIVDVALDVKQRWTSEQLAQKLCFIPDRLAWLEEPVEDRQVSKLSMLDVRVPIAFGECCLGSHDLSLLECEKIAIWQPDAAVCGGFSSFIDICRQACSRGLQVIPHGIGLLPATHLGVIGGYVDLVEFHGRYGPARISHLEIASTLLRGAMVNRPNLPGWGGRFTGSN